MNESEMKLQRVKKSCKVAKNVTRAFAIILMVIGIICIVSSIICFALREQINTGVGDSLVSLNDGGFAFTEKSVSIGLLSYDFQDMLNDGDYGKAAALACLAGGVVCILVSVIFGLLRRIFSTILASETPFAAEVLRKIKKLFIIITIFTAATIGIGAGGACALLVWCIYTILDYGFTLQTQVDETL